MRRPAPLLLATLLVLAPGRATAQIAPRDSVWLVTTTQQLLDAITTGDTTIWAAHLAPEWFLSDEEGQHITRSDFLAGLHPLPAGQSGKLTLARWWLAGDSAVAIISYDADEEHHYYGQTLQTRFHMTDVYLRHGAEWKQRASQVTALPRAIAGVSIPAALAKEYAGVYALTPDIRMSVSATDSGLVLRRQGRPDERLYALSPQLFIRHGMRGVWVFDRDSAGQVSGLVYWRDNNSVVWRRDRGSGR